MAERLETLLTAERRLLQDISHELRSPLARLNIAIELTRHADDRDAAAERLQREADRLTSLLGSLIEVTRLEGDPAAVKLQPLSAGAIVDEVVAGCTLEAGARRCRIVVRNDITRRLSGYPELLRRAVENVLRNAIRYAPRETSGGIGLGLSIASRAVRLHHGSLVVENAHPGLRVSLLPESANYQTAS